MEYYPDNDMLQGNMYGCRRNIWKTTFDSPLTPTQGKESNFCQNFHFPRSTALLLMVGLMKMMKQTPTTNPAAFKFQLILGFFFQYFQNLVLLVILDARLQKINQNREEVKYHEKIVVGGVVIWLKETIIRIPASENER